MNNIYLRGQVESAIKTEWEQFAKNHPHQANVLDQDLLIEELTESLRHDPEFNDALMKAQAIGTGLNSVIDFVQTWVGRRLRLL